MVSEANTPSKVIRAQPYPQAQSPAAAISALSPHVRERVQVVQGSHDDIGVVTGAFAGADCVFWLVPPNRHAESVEVYDAEPRTGQPTSFRQWCGEVLRPAVLA